MTRRPSPHIAAARRRWPAAEWIIGDGPYASVAYCDVATVMLFATEAEAWHAQAFIDRLACGGSCAREHELVNLDVPAPGGAATEGEHDDNDR